MSNPDNALVPSQQQPAPVADAKPAPQSWQLDQAGANFWSNIDEATQQGKYLTLKCEGQADCKADDVINKVWQTKWLFAKPASKTDDKTGEVNDYILTVLVTPDGRTLSFGSAGVLRSLAVLVRLYGKGPWDPPLPLTLKQYPCGENKRTYRLELPADFLGQLPEEKRRAK